MQRQHRRRAEDRRRRRRASSCASRSRTAGVTVAAITLRAPTTFRVEGVPQDRDAQFRQAADEIAGDQLRPQSARRRLLRVHDEADHRARPARAGGRAGDADDRSPRQRARRHRAEHRAPAEGRRDPGAAARRQRRRARQGHHRHRRRSSSSSWSRPGRARRRTICSSSTTASCPASMEILPGHGRARRRRRRHASSTSSARSRRSPGRICAVAKPGLDENNQPAVHFELKSDGAREVRQAVGREHRPLSGDRPRQPRVSAPQLEGRITDQGRISGGFTAESANDLSLTLRSGALPAVADLPRRAGRRPVARRRLDPRRRHLVARRPAADHAVHARSTTSCRASTRSSRWSST